MTVVIIDKELCVGCGVCADICPYRAIQLKNGKAEYILSEQCFCCGHCQAACPEDAVLVDGLISDCNFSSFTESVSAVQSGTQLISELVTLMRSRRSCRRYQAETVSLKILRDLVKIGVTAPSGTNSQLWGFSILQRRDDVLMLGDLIADYYRKLNRQARNGILRLLAKLFYGDRLGAYYRGYYDSVAEALREWDEEGKDRLFHGATAVILVSARRGASCPAEDALLATQNILLAAHAMGLGSCLIGFAVEAMRRCPDIKRKMGIDEDEDIYSAIALGYPAVKYYRPAGRKGVTVRELRP